MKPRKVHAGLLIFMFIFIALTGCRNNSNSTVYEFIAVNRSTLERTVSSTGTLHPVAIVRVLPRMSGKVEMIYTDFNSIVLRGDILAELNTDVLRLRREQQLAQVIKARANYELQLLNFQHQRELAERNLISDFDFRNSRTSLDIMRAELAAAEANLQSIEIEINQYAFITSPIDGIILERTINIGDTVVDSSSSNSAAIFTIAENLEEMQIESWVGELDITSIQEGQDVRFTLESLPGRTFMGKVESKRLLPSIQDGVVSYKVIISVNNRDGSLLPGMTCSVEIIEERVENIYVVPNAALRYNPTSLSAAEIEEIVFNAGLRGLDETQRAASVQQRQEAQRVASNAQAGQGGLAGLLNPTNMARMQRAPAQGGQRAGGRTEARTNLSPPRPLWFVDSNGKLDVIMVHTGINDGSRTEIHPRAGEEIPEGMRVILRERVR